MYNPSTALVFWLGGAQDLSGAFVGFSANPQNPFDNSQSRVQPAFDFQRATVPPNPPPAGARLMNVTISGSASHVTPPGFPPGTVYNWYLYQYLPPNNQIGTSPYLYFKPVGGQYGIVSGTSITYSYWTQPIDAAVIVPYKDSHGYAPLAFNTGVKDYAWVNPKTYQLLCPGLDGRYGNLATVTNNNMGPNSVVEQKDSGGRPAPLWSDGTNYDQSYGPDDMTNFTNGATVGDDAP